MKAYRKQADERVDRFQGDIDGEETGRLRPEKVQGKYMASLEQRRRLYTPNVNRARNVEVRETLVRLAS